MYWLLTVKKIMKFTHLHIILTLIFAVALTACTKQAWYQGAQSSQTAHCMKEPLSEYENCTQPSAENYDQYNKNREHLLKEKHK